MLRIRVTFAQPPNKQLQRTVIRRRRERAGCGDVGAIEAGDMIFANGYE